MNLGHHVYELSGAITGNGKVHTLEGVDRRFERHYFTIEFYADSELTNFVSNANLTGSVTLDIAVTGDQFFTVSNGTIVLGTDNYDMPTAQGSYNTYRLDLNGITAPATATHFKLLANVYEV